MSLGIWMLQIATKIKKKTLLLKNDLQHRSLNRSACRKTSEIIGIPEFFMPLADTCTNIREANSALFVFIYTQIKGVSVFYLLCGMEKRKSIRA